jgi:hypothetical protein
MSDPWTGTRCPICPRQWPVDTIRQQCIDEHGPARPATEDTK